MTHPIDELGEEQRSELREDGIRARVREDIGALRDAHAEQFDDGKTCGNVIEHYVLFNTRAAPRP